MTDVVGAVLVGGASSRMGTDKALIDLDGVPAAARVAAALTAGGAQRVVLVGADRSHVDLTWIDGIADRWPGAGPLGAIATALLDVRLPRWDQAGRAIDEPDDGIVVVAACDQPDVGAALVGALVRSLLASPPSVVAAAASGSDGRRQPFPSAWRTTAGPAVAALVGRGARRASAAFEVGQVVRIEAPDRALADLDTPDDLARWRGRRSTGSDGHPGNGATSP